jgi:hypothetical protein
MKDREIFNQGTFSPQDKLGVISQSERKQPVLLGRLCCFDMSGPQKRFATVLKRAKASYGLEIARERRLKAIEKSKTVLSAGTSAIEAVKERVREMIKNLGQLAYRAAFWGGAVVVQSIGRNFSIADIE